ncbi:MAG TPA: hypothetical protein VHZ26_08390 [Caulobacteraceae bacterium]|jgi:hypothetical protein|nr:hypothetical protein [Caulobacteraceae bacterium]
MQSRDFCFWLQGFFELSGEGDAISAGQAAMIRRHLDMVFAHEIAPRRPAADLRERPARPGPTPPGPVAPPAPHPDPAPAPRDEPGPRPPVVPPQPPLC